jgi:YVTN family beta-propeller protein
MIRTMPFVRTRRFLGGLAIVMMLAAAQAAGTSSVQGQTRPADPGASTKGDAPTVEALGTVGLGVGQLRAEAVSAEVSRATAASVEAARAKAASSRAKANVPNRQVHLPSDQTALVRRERITGDLSPSSVVASPTGLITVQNMMYRHTISVFTRDGKLRDTVDDSVDLSRFGIDGHPGISRGAPVEAAFTHDGKHVYVSNYSMSGTGFGPEGLDTCTPAAAPGKSFLYRIDTTNLKIDQVIPVGAVPKNVAVTPDDSTVLVTNSCSSTMSVVNVRTARLAATIPVDGAYPRGIAISPDSKTAFVAVMGSEQVVRIDLSSKRVSTLAHTASGPRHVLISPDGRFLYVTNSRSGSVSKIDAATGKVLRTVPTGDEPRSMAISGDGLAVYVLNYKSSTVSKLRTSDLRQIARTATDLNPVGIAYEPTTGSVWVACHSGGIIIFDDSKRARA